jgi:hypothetical protein
MLNMRLSHPTITDGGLETGLGAVNSVERLMGSGEEQNLLFNEAV